MILRQTFVTNSSSSFVVIYYDSDLKESFFDEIGVTPFLFDLSSWGKQTKQVTSRDMIKRIKEIQAQPLTSNEEWLDIRWCTQAGLHAYKTSLEEWKEETKQRYREDVERYKDNSQYPEDDIEEYLAYLKKDFEEDLNYIQKEIHVIEVIEKAMSEGYRIYPFEAFDHLGGIDQIMDYYFEHGTHIHVDGIGGLISVNNH